MIPIQFITYTTPTLSHEESAMRALAGGCQWIELHIEETDNEFQDIENIAKRLLKVCHDKGATLVLYNQVDLCKKIQADGVRMPANFTDMIEVREALGHEFIIGGTAHTFDSIKKLKRTGTDYICSGTFAAEAPTQEDFDIAQCNHLTRQLYQEEVRIPVCVYGNIAYNNIMPIIENGAQGVCISQTSLPIEANLEQDIQKMLHADQ